MFRTCDITGFKVDRKVEPLIKANAVVAVVSLLLGVTGALLLVLTRWQVVHLLLPDWYYRMLTFHGLNALVFWIVFFEIAGLYFGSTIILNCKMSTPGVGWFAFILTILGFGLVNYAVLAGKADVLFTSYVPLRAEPVYYLGIILFAVGALIACFLFLANLKKAKQEKTYEGSLPLFTYGLLAACIIAILTIATGAIIYIPTLLWSLGYIKSLNPAMYKLVFWGFGHSSQQINVTAMISIWYLGAFLTVGGTSINEKVSRIAFMLYIIGINVASAHHILSDPGVGTEFKIFNTSYIMYIAVLASLIHAFAVPSAIESAQRRRGFTKGLFDWLINAPWGNPAFSAVLLGMLGFGFIGGVTGVINGMEQTNTIIHNTLSLPGHFKGTVVIGTTLTFMGAAYYIVPLVFRKKIAFFKLAQLQPWIFAGGVALLSSSMYILGAFGIPRRHYDITFTGSAFTHTFNPATDLFWVLFAIGGILAVTGALIWIIIIVVSVFFGKSLTGPQDMQLAVASPAPEAKEHKGLEAPGTLVLSILFMVVFLTFIALNYGWLTAMWEVK
ncbi:MAG: cbb3-type cytochrome c oxidase subunit I [Nitrospirae bacterium]|nr:cbb3-type cytochrome c oxidase subunit I [Nitrospirota bacterium]